MSDNQRYVCMALAGAAALISVSGHDGWGWCLFLIWLIWMDE